MKNTSGVSSNKETLIDSSSFLRVTNFQTLEVPVGPPDTNIFLQICVPILLARV